MGQSVIRAFHAYPSRCYPLESFGNVISSYSNEEERVGLNGPQPYHKRFDRSTKRIKMKVLDDPDHYSILTVQRERFTHW